MKRMLTNLNFDGAEVRRAYMLMSVVSPLSENFIEQVRRTVMNRQILSPIIVVLACGSILTAQWSDDPEVNLQVTDWGDEKWTPKTGQLLSVNSA